ncbi:Ger(x)C family spore germination protein [Fictibacillus iocasae]|uniref:Ger(X)C family spore germination protein n=1 Tax=Fictibacillus iocasae TaxID=2715437 RepID=A0ABW2NR08_9BACL
MNKKWLYLPLVFSLFLTGCWDQVQLNQIKLIKAGGFDYTKDGKVRTTAAIPQVQPGAKDEGQERSQVFSAVGHTARQTRIYLDRRIAERVDSSKNLIIVLGKEAAQKDIYNILDVFYRDPKSALNAKLAISSKKASDIINTRFQEPNVATGNLGEYLYDLVESAEETSFLPDVNIQTICPVMFDPGQDFALPYLQPDKKEVEVIGVAVFKEHVMAGTILGPKSILFNFLNAQESNKSTSATRKLPDINESGPTKYVTFRIKKSKRKFNVSVNQKGDIRADLTLNLAVSIGEIPMKHKTDAEGVKMVEQQLSKELTKEAHGIIKKLQSYNSDTFGVGRQLIAFHNDAWRKIDQKNYFKTVDFHSKVNVKVVGFGIIE